MKKKKTLCSHVQKATNLFDKIVSNLYKTCQLIQNLEKKQDVQQQNQDTIIPFVGLEGVGIHLKQARFIIKSLKNGDKVYEKDGINLRKDTFNMGYIDENIIQNIEQQKYLEFKGQLGVKGYKIKQWNYFWKGQYVGGGCFNIMGQKEGHWIDLCKNYWDKKQILEVGCYSKGQRIGEWSFKWNTQQECSGGGTYMSDGNEKKIGKWIEFDDGFSENQQVIYQGEYSMEGMKIGRWDSLYCKNGENQYKQIGGGQYDQNGNQKKIGEWIELDEGFNENQQVIYQGEYSMEGMKIRRWDSFYCKVGEKNMHKCNNQKESSGGGSYDQDGNQKKIGKWIELNEGFSEKKKVISKGEYDMHGMKIGRWDSFYCKEEEKQYKQIGGGLYNQNGKQEKTEKWVELVEGFCDNKQVIYHGQYNMQGMKIGRWDSFYCKDGEQYAQIGGGSYDQAGNQKKIGKWIELDKEFQIHKQVTYNGEYNNQGVKIGRWDSIDCKDGEKEYKQIGGGQYDQDGNSKKIGKWVELDKGFSVNKYVTYNGVYNIQGMKIGRWDSIDCKDGEKEYKQIGGGQYDQDGNQKKIGKWIELDEGFSENKQVIYNIGRWDSLHRSDGEKQYKQMQILFKYEEYSGGGQYDQDGNQKKIGRWIGLDEGFREDKQVVFSGEYNIQGLKIGKWDSLYRSDEENEYKQIGGGSYDQNGNQKKIGKWIDLDGRLNQKRQVIYNGEYNMQVMKIGRWNSMYCEVEEDEYKQIDGGLYDQDGNQKKIGKWIELDYWFGEFKQVTYSGEYNIQGMKIARWDSLQHRDGENENQLIGGGQYDQDGNQKKIGEWIELDEDFQENKQATYSGQYNLQGKKIGMWDIKFCRDGEKEYKYIGGGSYDEDGNEIKIGKWVELISKWVRAAEQFQIYSVFTYSGEYNMHEIKIGKWQRINKK